MFLSCDTRVPHDHSLSLWPKTRSAKHSALGQYAHMGMGFILPLRDFASFFLVAIPVASLPFYFLRRFCRARGASRCPLLGRPLLDLLLRFALCLLFPHKQPVHRGPVDGLPQFVSGCSTLDCPGSRHEVPALRW